MNEMPLFKKGTFKLHENPNINYQLNRAINWSNADVALIKKIGDKAKDIKCLVNVSFDEAVLQEQQGNINNAIACYRLSDFFLTIRDDRKMQAYNKATFLFNKKNERYFENHTVEKGYIDYEQKKLKYYRVIPDCKVKDTIILHGGFDSYQEEFFETILYLRCKGYQVILFDGPGQGYANRVEKFVFVHEWEHIVKIIHDQFDIEHSTIIGISLGAMLAPRAAAYEKRIKRVVSVGLMPNFFDVLISTRNKKIQCILKFLFKNKCKKLINFLLNKNMKSDPLAEWGLRHGMEIFGSRTPYDFLVKAKLFNINDIGRDVSQDVFVICGDEDHFIPLDFYKPMLDAFSHVNSLTLRILNHHECAENHCQVGNFKLLLDIVDNWICERLQSSMDSRL